MMPKQLEEGLKRFRKLKLRPRPIAEKLPQININKLTIPIDDKVYVLPNAAFAFPIPRLATVRLSCDCIELNYKPLHRGELGRRQVFQIYPIKTGYGIRFSFQCDCGKGALKLYHHDTRLACKHCHRVRMASQTLGKQSRPLLQAIRLESFLTNKPKLRQAKERLKQKLGEKALMAQSAYSSRATNLWK